MDKFFELFFYLYVICYGLYGILIVPCFCSKILSRTGGNERFYFVITALFHSFALCFCLISAHYRKRLRKKDKALFFLFILGCCMFFSVIFFLE